MDFLNNLMNFLNNLNTILSLIISSGTILTASGIIIHHDKKTQASIPQSLFSPPVYAPIPPIYRPFTSRDWMEIFAQGLLDAVKFIILWSIIIYFVVKGLSIFLQLTMEIQNSSGPYSQNLTDFNMPLTSSLLDHISAVALFFILPAAYVVKVIKIIKIKRGEQKQGKWVPWTIVIIALFFLMSSCGH